ncbi:hypothetical protein M409DRAFT_60585 [Zasmidium cellare ATCC 36951]|uniref:Fungal N-terminal domain-containing protein n=1 Tax=Zasmidium cellare ATCC 36951 TaxID=1080233 RepID=A0A6A6C1F8_ZASCE|nr:uncharacterized protein M409DRAFT_60585 [Zasmidium cellare ATCC 36951]KAF2159652.1 hypothetical protein M409DRAFT_60585 [Zasmidium cellare ATCC 36951]
MEDPHESTPTPNDQEIIDQRDSGIEIDVPITDDEQPSRDAFDPGGSQLLSNIQRFSIASSKLGNKFLFQTTQRSNEMAKYLDKLRHTEESILQIAERFLGQREENLRNTGPKVLQDLKAQLATDRATLRDQSQVVLNVHASTGTTQYRLLAVQSKLRNALAKHNKSLPGGTAVFAEMNNEFNAELLTPSEVTDDLPQQAQSYFDAVGSIAVLQERLLELDDEHAEARTGRDLAVDQERELSTSDSVFENLYHNSRSELIRSLQDRMMTADQAKQACDDQGIDLDSLRHRQPTETSQADDDASDGHAQSLWLDRPDTMDFAMPQVDEIFLTASGVDVKQGDVTVTDGQGNGRPNSERIESWLSRAVDGEAVAEGHLVELAEAHGRIWLGDTRHPDHENAAGGDFDQNDSMAVPRSAFNRRKAVRAFHRASHRRCSVSAIDA